MAKHYLMQAYNGKTQAYASLHFEKITLCQLSLTEH
jgi:hypothetical protein